MYNPLGCKYKVLKEQAVSIGSKMAEADFVPTPVELYRNGMFTYSFWCRPQITAILGIKVMSVWWMNLL
jgi:hypothetical protein